jgi:hypothetical protein
MFLKGCTFIVHKNANANSMKKNTNRQPENNMQDDLHRTDPDHQRKGYNEQNPSQPQGSFKPDKDQSKKTEPTSAKKRAAEKGEHFIEKKRI